MAGDGLKLIEDRMTVTSGQPGRQQSLPHLIAVDVIFKLMDFCIFIASSTANKGTTAVGAGLTQLFDRFPTSYTLLRFGSVLYLVGFVALI